MHISRVARDHGYCNSHDLFNLAISLGGKRVGGGWYALPHLCGGKMPGDSVGGGGLKIHPESGGVFCHYGCSKLDAERAVYNADVHVDTQHVYEREPEPQQKKAKYRNQPFGVLEEVEAQLYLLNVDIGHEASVQYRRAKDGLIGKHVRYIGGGKTQKKTPGIKGDGWEPRIWAPKERIREYLVVTEGEKDAATACVNGLTAASYAGGAGRVGATEWSIVLEYAAQNGLEIIQCPDTGDAGTNAKDKLGKKYGWPVADMNGVPDGDCPMDMPDWLARVDARKPWAPEQTESEADLGESAGEEEPRFSDGTGTGKTSSEEGKNGDPCFNAKGSGGSRFSDDEDKTGGFDDGTHEGETPSADEQPPIVPRDNIPSPEVFPCDDWGWDYTEHDMHDGDTSKIRERCHKCEGCILTRRAERASLYARWREQDVQTTVCIPGWKDIEDLVRFRGLDIHKKRTPSGKRVSSILPEAHRTYALVFVYDGEMDEDQQNRVIQHAAKHRYGMEASVTVGSVTQRDFESLVSDEASIESEDRKYNCLSLRCWTQTEDLADYAMGKGRPESLPLCDEPMTKSHIPVQHRVVLDLYRKPQADGDPVWRTKLEIVASYFAREWMIQCGHLAASVVRSDVRTLGDWRGPIGLIQNAGRFIEGKRPWRDAYGWVLLLAGLGEHIPEDRRYYFERDDLFRYGVHAHHKDGRLDEDWTANIEPAESDTDDHEDPRPHRRAPEHERPRPSHVCDAECDHGDSDLFWDDLEEDDWQYERMAA